MKETKVGSLRVCIYPDRATMGKEAAKEAASAIRFLLTEQEEVNVIFAAAPSQNEFLDALSKAEGIDWGRINAFHMDEYVGLPMGTPGSFTGFLNQAIFDRLPFKTVYRMDGAAPDPQAECRRYAALLKIHPADVVFLGVGENGHIAFNDPPVADFRDPEPMKIVQLDPTCRMQQVHDKCFASIEEVPSRAYTLTVPTMVSGKRMFCIVPGKTKAQAIRKMLLGDISINCPASILRTKAQACLYLDMDSAQEYLQG